MMAKLVTFQRSQGNNSKFATHLILLLITGAYKMPLKFHAKTKNKFEKWKVRFIMVSWQEPEENPPQPTYMTVDVPVLALSQYNTQ